MKPATQISPSEEQDQNALQKWRPLFEAEMEQVNELIVELAEDINVPLIGEMARHLIASGGKRLRPTLTILSAKLCGYEGDRHIKLAAAIEFIHTATLLHDDVVDESKLRRGRITANEQWGNSASVLVGDFLLSRAFQLMSRDGSLKVLRILSDASATISAGEVNQMVAQNDLDTDTDKYLDIIGAKTAKLFSAGCQLGAVVTEKSDEEEKALEDYGQYLGNAFQIVDDVLDYSAKQIELGKTVGDDFKEGKVTLPVILAFATANDDEKKFWKRTLEDNQQNDEDLDTAISFMQKHDILESAMQTARDFADKGAKTLEIFPDSKEKQALLDLLEFAVDRPY